MQLQHLNVKLMVETDGQFDLDVLIPIFHGWIQDQVCEELLVDVADYGHVYAGPGVVLIGHEANYSVDNTDERLGVRYNRKAALDGSNQDRLAQATRAALIACRRLEADPRLEGKLRFNGRDLDVFINDRLIAPNCAASREAVGSELHTFLRELFGEGEYAMSFAEDPRRLFSVSVRTSHRLDASELLNILGANPRVTSLSG